MSIRAGIIGDSGAKQGDYEGRIAGTEDEGDEDEGEKGKIKDMRYAVCGGKGRRDEGDGSYFRIQPLMDSVLETSFPALTFLCVEISDLFRRKLRDISRCDHQDK